MGKRTTDEIRRTQIRYLGPRSLTLPFHLTFVQWGIYIGFALPLGLAGLVLLGPSWFGMGAGTGIGIAFFVARAVSPDRPARTVIRTALTDWRATRPLASDTPQLPHRFTTDHLTRKDGDDL